MLGAATLISFTGSQAAQIALLYWIYELTGSAIWVSAALFGSSGVLAMSGPLGGWLGDRFPRQRVMIGSELGASAAYMALAAFVQQPEAVVVLALVASAVNSPFGAASGAAVPNWVDNDNLNWANGVMGAAMNAALLAGPLLGGVLIATVSPSLVFGVNAASFGISASLIALISQPFGTIAPKESRIRDGLKVIVAQTRLRSLVGTSTLTFGAIGIALVSDVPLAHSFGAGSVGYALLSSLWGAGALLGAWVAGHKPSMTREGRILLVGILAMAFSLGSIPVLPTFTLVVLTGALGGLGSGLFFVPWFTLVQRAVPDELRSRVLGTAVAFEQSAFALGMLAAGPLVSYLGPQLVYLLPAALLLFASIIVGSALGPRRTGS